MQYRHEIEYASAMLAPARGRTVVFVMIRADAV